MKAKAILAAGLIAVSGGLAADDTDIYMSGIAPPTSVPIVMFTIDNSSSAGAVYAGCANVGTGLTMCAPAKWFKDNCSSCVLPAATEPLTYFHVMRYALRMTLLQMTGMKVGLILNHQNENNCAGPRPSGTLSAAQRCSNGAYVARRVKLLDQVTTPANPLLGTPETTGPGPNLQEFFAILDALPVPQGGAAHPYQGKEVFFELFRYLTGQNVYNGHNGYADYGTDDSQNLDADRPAYDWDAGAEASDRYVSPLTADLTCTKIFTVNFVMNGSSQDADSDEAIDTDSAGGMVGIDLTGTSNDLSTVVEYLYDVDLARTPLPFGTVPALTGKQNVTSYFFTKPTPLNSNPPTFDKTTTDYAKAGGSVHPLPFSADPAEMVNQVRAALNQILSVSTSFVSGSVPVNVFSRTQVLSDVYLALFQPDAVAKPFWAGNMKKLRATVVEVPCPPDAVGCTATREVRLHDALNQAAIDDDGRISSSSLTYWTDGSRIAADPTRGVLAGRDGRFVNLGGAGQQTPGYISGTAAGGPGYLNSEIGARQMYLYPGTGRELLPLSADLSAAVTYQVHLGATDAAESLRILKRIRGYDTYDYDSDLNTTEVLPWMMADPLHSKPLPINYGAYGGHTQANPAIFIAMATNDGLLHFIRNTTSGGAQSGAEAWAFMPIDVMGIQKALAVNTALSKRLYGLDGAPASYILDVDRDGTIEPADGDKVYLYVGMRRGGRAYYALDVTDPTAPKFLWRITPTARSWGSAADGSGGQAVTADFAEMGFTFSQPRLARIRTVDGSGTATVRPVVVFGGGYDPLLNDYSALTLGLFKLGLPSVGSLNTDDLMGNAVFVVDAVTGELVWKAAGPVSVLGTLLTAGAKVFPHAQLKDSIPSTLTVVDTDSDGFHDRIVVGDTGGNVWRVDMPATSTSDWKLTLLAKLGRHAGSGKLNDRRFFHEPDFVLSQDENGPFDAVVLGSGDREDPMDYGRERAADGTETRTENALFMLKDRKVGIGSASDSDPITFSQLADVTDNCLQGGFSLSCNPNLANGWRIQLRQGQGEKMLSAPLTAAGRIYVTTYLPPRSNEATTCGPSEGGGLFYSVGLKKGTASFNYNTSDGGTDLSPNSAADRFETLASAGIPTEVVYINLPDASGNEVKCALGSDLNCRALPGATRFRTFWFKEE